MSTFQFGAGAVFGTQVIDASGVAVAVLKPVQLGTLQDVTLDISFESKELYGASQFPVAVGRGKGKITGKAKTASIDGRLLSEFLIGRPQTTNVVSIVPNEARAIAATVAIVPPITGTFARDLGVVNAVTGDPLTRVASGPTAGQYSVVDATGVYSFAAADVTSAFGVLISYEFTKASGGKVLTINNELMGVSPFFAFDLRTSYQGKELTLKLVQCVSNKFNLPFGNGEFVVPDFEFSAMANAAGVIGYFAER